MTFEPQFDVTVLNDDFARSSAETVDLVTEFLAS
jgi:guanylate kinase